MKAGLATFFLIAAASTLVWFFWPGVMSSGQLTLPSGRVFAVSSDTGTVRLSHDQEKKTVIIDVGAHEIRIAASSLQIDGSPVQGFAIDPEVKSVSIRVEKGLLLVRAAERTLYEGKIG